MIKNRAHFLVSAASSLALIILASPGFARDSEHKKHDGKPEHLSVEERLAEMRAEAEERHKEDLKKALERLELAKETKGQNPQGYFSAMVSVAAAYRTANEMDRADKMFDQAVDFYKAHQSDLRDLNTNRGFWHYLTNRSNDQKLDDRFFDILAIAEKTSPNDISLLDNVIRDTLDYGRFNQRNAEDKKQVWAKVLSIRESVRGKDDPSLVPLLQRYASACEGCHDIDGAEQAYIRANSLDSDKSRESKAQRLLNLAQFYIRHGMYEKADTSWHKAEELVCDAISEGSARSFYTLYEAYLRAGHQKDADAVLSAMLAHGGNNVINQFDPKLTDMVNGYISSFAFDKAEDLIQKRIKAGADATGDSAAGDWQLKLSNLYLATGKIADSKKIFDQLLAVRALQGRPTDSLREKRAQLLESLNYKEAAAAMRQGIAPRPVSPLAIQYLLLASDEIKFSHNTSFFSFDSSSSDSNPLPAFGGMRGADISVCSLGTLQKGSNFLFGGTIYCGEASPSSAAVGISPGRPVSFSGTGGLPGVPIMGGRQTEMPAPRISIAPALKPPLTLAGDNTQSASGMMNTSQLEPGDYLFDNRQHFMLSATPGRRRIFLSDANTSTGEFNINQLGGGRNWPIDLQVWYDGTGRISAGGMRGIVYAPNATVVIPFNGEFTGAIVAARIICEGNNRLNFDKSLLGVDLK